MQIEYTEDRAYTPEQLQALFGSVKWLSARYPNKLARALKNSGTVITAWNGESLVGLVNVLDDGALTAYVPYLCVHAAYQKKGIGRELLRRVKQKYKGYLYLILIAENAPLIGYYEKNGFGRADGTFVMKIQNETVSPN